MTLKDLTIQTDCSEYISAILEYTIFFGLITRKRKIYADNGVYLLWHWLDNNELICLLGDAITIMYEEKKKLNRENGRIRGRFVDGGKGFES